MRKTLDEVIKALEICTSDRGGCENCPYDPDCTPDYKWDDAIYYLKEYRSEKAMWEADRKGHLDWIEQYKEAREKHQQSVIEMKKNPPLTWGELRQMEGKPVWVEFPGKRGHWDIVRDIGRIYEGEDPDTWMWFYVGDKKPKTLYGKWQAYRKERE